MDHGTYSSYSREEYEPIFLIGRISYRNAGDTEFLREEQRIGEYSLVALPAFNYCLHLRVCAVQINCSNPSLDHLHSACNRCRSAGAR